MITSQQIVYDKNKLYKLQEILNEKIPEIIEKLQIDLSRYTNYYVGQCPIHGGDNKTAFNIYLSGNKTKGNWNCYTHSCQDIFKPTILGFIRGVLSNKLNNWRIQTDNKVSFKKVIDWCCDLLKIKFNDIDTSEEIKKSSYDNEVKVKENNFLLTKQDIRKRLIFPAKVMIDRGFSKEILNKYDVGLCLNKYKPMYQRVVVPVYDNNYSYVVGCLGRTIYKKCEKCNSYHKEGSDCSNKLEKWRNSKFHRSSSLYNYWFAKQEIKRKKSIIVCEGPCDIWRLEEAGIHNAVAIYGVKLSEEQILMLQQTGANKVFLGLNNKNIDNAAKEATPKIIKRLEKLFKIKELELCQYKDFADCPINFIHERIYPIINNEN